MDDKRLRGEDYTSELRELSHMVLESVVFTMLWVAAPHVPITFIGRMRAKAAIRLNQHVTDLVRDCMQSFLRDRSEKLRLLVNSREPFRLMVPIFEEDLPTAARLCDAPLDALAYELARRSVSTDIDAADFYQRDVLRRAANDLRVMLGKPIWTFDPHDESADEPPSGS